MKKATTILPFDANKRKGKHLFWERHKIKFKSMSLLLVVCNQKKVIALQTLEVTINLSNPLWT
jgi:hypothetical protein